MPDVLELKSRTKDNLTRGGAPVGDNAEAGSRPCDCSRPIDLVHLARYTLGDRTLEREVLQLFQSHSRLQLDRLVAAAGDAKKWRDAAHAIKGSARGVGAWPLAVVAERAELADGGSQAIQVAIVKDVSCALTEANAYIDTLFAA